MVKNTLFVPAATIATKAYSLQPTELVELKWYNQHFEAFHFTTNNNLIY